MATFSYYVLALLFLHHRWALHGMWPERGPGDWPQWCARGFNESALADLQPTLDQDWPLTLHEHEWSRHGSCSGLGEHAYFALALEAYRRYDLNALNATHVPPLAGELQAAFLAVHKHHLIVSRRVRGHVVEARMCLAKDGEQLIECPRA